jgi:hypothetical protein
MPTPIHRIAADRHFVEVLGHRASHDRRRRSVKTGSLCPRLDIPGAD